MNLLASAPFSDHRKYGAYPLGVQRNVGRYRQHGRVVILRDQRPRRPSMCSTMVTPTLSIIGASFTSSDRDGHGLRSQCRGTTTCLGGRHRDGVGWPSSPRRAWSWAHRDLARRPGSMSKLSASAPLRRVGQYVAGVVGRHRIAYLGPGRRVLVHVLRSGVTGEGSLLVRGGGRHPHRWPTPIDATGLSCHPSGSS